MGLKLKAKKLIVTAKDEQADKEHTFPVFEFENGAIMVLGNGCSADWFFDSREEIQGNGLDIIQSVDDAEDSIEFDNDDLWETIKQSQAEWGSDAGKIKELLKVRP